MEIKLLCLHGHCRIREVIYLYCLEFDAVTERSHLLEACTV